MSKREGKRKEEEDEKKTNWHVDSLVNSFE